jgi:photosystem II stability/assembly factor-like uncharacterized protein
MLKVIPTVTMIWLPLFLLFSVWSVQAKDAPVINKKAFESMPYDVKYFEDSDVILTLEESGEFWRSDDAGANWHKPEDIDGRVIAYYMHPINKERAYALGIEEHWFTKDKGKSWTKFNTDRVAPTRWREPFVFHAGDPEKVIFTGEICKGFSCYEKSFYTTDDCKNWDSIREESNTRGCTWAAATIQSASNLSEDSQNRMLCIIEGPSGLPEDNKLLVSDNYFKESHEPHMKDDRTVKGIINITVVKGYIIVAAKSEGSTELSLFVSLDGELWHIGVFPEDHKIHEGAYTILESTNYSLQVDAKSNDPRVTTGTLFSSNSNGTYFTKNQGYTHRNIDGIIDFEQIQGIQGIIMLNVVKNGEDFEAHKARAQVVSKISFDDGRTWKPLKVKGEDEDLHLHSVTDMSNSGRVFSSPAPGLVMGIGNTGDYLKAYTEGDLWVSDDAGLTWKRARSEAHKYEFGDQGTIIVAVYDEGTTDKIYYSLNRGDGEKWSSADLPHDNVRAGFLTTIPDSTSMKFILQGTRRHEGKSEYYLYSIDFNGIYDKKCEDEDFEVWTALLDEKENANCLMGHTQTYRRRSKDAKCYVGEKFKESLPIPKNCKCTWKDYECDYNYVLDGEGENRKCKPTTPLKAPPGACKDNNGTFEWESGFRKIPGNTCEEGVKKDEEKVERPCDQAKENPPPDGKIRLVSNTFPATDFGQVVYLERAETATGNDETIVMSTVKGRVVSGIYKTTDHGKTWKQILEDDENIQQIIPHPYQKEGVFFFAPNSKKVIYSINRLRTFGSFDVPAPPTISRIPSMVFHPKKLDHLMWIGSKDCGSYGSNCHNVAYTSKNLGDSWDPLARYTEKCEFIQKLRRGNKEDLIYCEQHKDEIPNGQLQLQATLDMGDTFETKAEDILAFATMSEFIIVAQKDPESNLKVRTSIDGQTFADAQFPRDFNVPHQTAYTVLDSSTHAVFLHVTVEDTDTFEYGRIMKSNGNGTSYVLSIDKVNRDHEGYVDFEKMQGIDGLALVNVVANTDEKKDGKVKKLRSMITHDDGAIWAPLKAPKNGPEGESWSCDVGDVKECSLHLHSYTEREDPKETFYSPSAAGVMMGVGNVGKHLGNIHDRDNVYTFITTDAGVTWKAVMKGRFRWEFGDQGSIIVIVERVETNYGYYSLDEGGSWKRFDFSDEKLTVTSLTTVPSDNSKQFLLWTKNGKGEAGTINVDFSAIRSNEQCKVDDDHNHGSDDYVLWTPIHPESKRECIFGRTVHYLRKKPEADCWNGPQLERIHGTSTNCTCEREDFEW